MNKIGSIALALAAWSLIASAQPASEVADLPLVIAPATRDDTHLMAVIVSGDGGWATIDKTLAAGLSQHGIPVVGLDALRYFWSRRTPEGSAADLVRILNHFLRTWRKDRVLLIGYSRGADVLPFMAARLPEALRSRVALIALLGPAPSVDFEFHLVDWLRSSAASHYQILPEVAKLHWAKVLCVFGTEESDSLCRTLDRPSVTRLGLPGAHHFGGHYQEITRAILDAVSRELGAAPADR